MKFAVTLLKPPNYLHTEAVREIAETIHYGLLRLGYDSILTYETNLSDRQHITLPPSFLVFYEPNLAPNTILYNFDQIYFGSPWLQTVLVDHLLQYPVWDYSPVNIEQLKQLGVSDIQLMPVGYVPELTRISPTDEDIDVLFYGSINDRRQQVLNALRARGVNVQTIFGVYGQERDALIARSKIVLNMHFYEAKVFEIVRVSYLLANRRFVISERGCDPAEEGIFAPGVIFADYDQLVDTCLEYLARPAERKQVAEAGFQLMVQRLETEYLQPVVEALEKSDRHQAPFVYQKDLFHKRQAALHLEQGDFDAAISLYEKSLDIDPDCHLSYWNLGLALLLKGDEMAAQFVWLSGISQGEPELAEARSSELLQVLQRSVLNQKWSDAGYTARIHRQIQELLSSSPTS